MLSHSYILEREYTTAVASSPSSSMLTIVMEVELTF
jgi:hypothetical protein